MRPVVGAVVSTSLDSNTALSDGGGFFNLKTNTAVAKDGCYTIIITGSGFPTYSVQGTWGPRVPADRNFWLSPPIPFLPGPPCTTH